MCYRYAIFKLFHFNSVTYEPLNKQLETSLDYQSGDHLTRWRPSNQLTSWTYLKCPPLAARWTGVDWSFLTALLSPPFSSRTWRQSTTGTVLPCSSINMYIKFNSSISITLYFTSKGVIRSHMHMTAFKTIFTRRLLWHKYLTMFCNISYIKWSVVSGTIKTTCKLV